MSLKQIDLKKNLDILTREYLINKTLIKVHSFLNSEFVDYFTRGGELRVLLMNLNRHLSRTVIAKEVKIWVRDASNNLIWTINLINEYESIELDKKELRDKESGKSIIHKTKSFEF
jgi:hypothetical protein